ncbi:MAG: type II secretion system protein GspG [Gemmatimonadetes bacterium]|nr:type II secretion system protein GspG [Gemmatimonadota bacterium]
MRKLILLIILLVVVVYYFPDSRTMVGEWTRPLWTPLLRWDARQEMAQVANDAVNEEIRNGKLPDQRRWSQWLDYRYAMDEMKKDPWGSTYQLKVWADSVAVVSYGPDRLRGTADDFQVSAPRQRSRR